MKSRILLAMLALAMVASISACKKEEGPVEKMGKAVDEAAQETEDAVKDAAEDVEDAVKDAKDGG